MKNLLTTTEAAAEVGLSPQTVRALICTGVLKAERLGKRSYIIKRSDLKYVKKRPKRGRPPRQSKMTGP
jgi:excisionase family DNA binding protein